MKTKFIFSVTLILLAMLFSCQVQKNQAPPMTQAEFEAKWKAEPTTPTKGKTVVYDSWDEFDQKIKAFHAELSKDPEESKGSPRGPDTAVLHIEAKPLWYWSEPSINSDGVRIKRKIYYGCEDITSYMTGLVIFQDYQEIRATYYIPPDQSYCRVTVISTYSLDGSVGGIGKVITEKVKRSRTWNQSSKGAYYSTPTFTQIYPQTPTTVPTPRPTTIRKPKKTSKKKKSAVIIPAGKRKVKGSTKKKKSQKTKKKKGKKF